MSYELRVALIAKLEAARAHIEGVGVGIILSLEEVDQLVLALARVDEPGDS